MRKNGLSASFIGGGRPAGSGVLLGTESALSNGTRIGNVVMGHLSEKTVVEGQTGP